MDDLLATCARAGDFLPLEKSAGAIGPLLKKDSALRDFARELSGRLHTAAEIFSPAVSPAPPPSNRPLRAVAWNIERGKKFAALQHVLKNHAQLKDADLIFLTEVDWGMARSENRNVPGELGEALGYYAYFAPSYYNFTLGHGSERGISGRNSLGLHGKAILSRWRLESVQAVGMPNATDKLHSKEARLGEKRALLGQLKWGDRLLTVTCAHLDAFSSPKSRSRQLREAAAACDSEHALLAGDFNTNILDSTSTSRLFFDLLKKIASTGPRQLIRNHFPYPERRYDRSLFEMLRGFGFDYESCNELGAGTYDLLSNDQELGEMASDQYPRWLLKWINRRVEQSGGQISLKLDWFAVKNLRCLERRVIRIGAANSPAWGRASDHHPIYLEFELPVLAPRKEG